MCNASIPALHTAHNNLTAIQICHKNNKPQTQHIEHPWKRSIMIGWHTNSILRLQWTKQLVNIAHLFLEYTYNTHKILYTPPEWLQEGRAYVQRGDIQHSADTLENIHVPNVYIHYIHNRGINNALNLVRTNEAGWEFFGTSFKRNVFR